MSGGTGGMEGLSAMFSDPGALAGLSQKLAAQANPDLISTALDQMSSSQGMNPTGAQNPMGMQDIIQPNPLTAREPGVPQFAGQVNLGNSAQTMMQGVQPTAQPRANLDPKSAALLSQMAAGRGDVRPPQAPSGGAGRAGTALAPDFSSLLFGSQTTAQKPNPRAAALAHLLGLVR